MKFISAAYITASLLSLPAFATQDGDTDVFPPKQTEAHAIPDVEFTVPRVEEARQSPGLLLRSQIFGLVPARDLDPDSVREGQKFICVFLETIQGEQWAVGCIIVRP